MSSSIYHFFKTLIDSKAALESIVKLDDFAFDENLLLCKRLEQFPEFLR